MGCRTGCESLPADPEPSDCDGDGEDVWVPEMGKRSVFGAREGDEAAALVESSRRLGSTCLAHCGAEDGRQQLLASRVSQLLACWRDKSNGELLVLAEPPGSRQGGKRSQAACARAREPAMVLVAS